MSESTYLLSEEAQKVLSKISEQSGVKTGVLVSEAIGLLEIVWIAKCNGKKLVEFWAK